MNPSLIASPFHTLLIFTVRIGIRPIVAHQEIQNAGFVTRACSFGFTFRSLPFAKSPSFWMRRIRESTEALVTCFYSWWAYLVVCVGKMNVCEKLKSIFWGIEMPLKTSGLFCINNDTVSLCSREALRLFPRKLETFQIQNYSPITIYFNFGFLKRNYKNVVSTLSNTLLQLRTNSATSLSRIAVNLSYQAIETVHCIGCERDGLASLNPAELDASVGILSP